MLFNGPTAAMAASHQPVNKKATAKKKLVKNPRASTHKLGLASKSSRKHKKSSDTALGQAEMLASGALGLRGQASYYGIGFNGQKTATGERFNAMDFTAASNRFPLGTMVAVRRLDNDLCAIVEINDRMAPKQKRVIDVSRGVAEYLDMVRAGVVMVRVAKLPIGWQQQGLGTCQVASEPKTESKPGCLSCLPDRLPEMNDGFVLKPDTTLDSRPIY